MRRVQPSLMALTPASIAQLRLRNQWITAPRRGSAPDVVDHLVAVQSQDYANARWSLGLRLRGLNEAAVERAFNRGEILRTHVLRPTWHFVRPADIRWLLELTGPRVQAASATAYRRSGFDASILRRAHKVIEKALQDGRFLTRDELRERLDSARIDTSLENGLAHLLMHAELEGLICSGPRRGKQFTYALLEQRVPPAPKRSRADALAELARRFFLSRAPATLHDLAKWSGLTLADCRAGLEASAPLFHSERFDGQEYWLGETPAPRPRAPRAHMLSVYDEYLSSYRPIPALASAQIFERARALGPSLMGAAAIDGVIVGTWSRTLVKDAARFRLSPFGRFTPAQRKLLLAAAQQYASFHGLKAAVD